MKIVADQSCSRKLQKIAIGQSHPWNHLEVTAITTSLTNLKGMTGPLRGSLTRSGQSKKLLLFRRSIRKETRSYSRWLHSSSSLYQMPFLIAIDDMSNSQLNVHRCIEPLSRWTSTLIDQVSILAVGRSTFNSFARYLLKVKFPSLYRRFLNC